MLSKPASMSTAWLPIQYLGNAVLKCVLCKTCCRSNRSSLTIYAIVFYAGVSPALEVQKSVIVLHFTNVLTVHQKNLNQIFIINGVLSDRYECYSKDVVA